MKIIYETNDGHQFRTEQDALAHYAMCPGAALIGLTQAQISASVDGECQWLADAIAAFGEMLRIGPRERGAAAFIARIPATIPASISGTPDGELWLDGWEAEQIKASEKIAAEKGRKAA